MIDRKYDLKGNPALSPAENLKGYLDCFPEGSTSYIRDHDGGYLRRQPAARKAFTGPGGKLDAEKIYREGVASGRKAGMMDTVLHEFGELMRYVLILDPSKEEAACMVDEFLKVHVPKSTPDAIKRSMNSQQWYRQANDILMFAEDA